ncbi:MAG: ExeA family protein [Candidatus Omnitrophota bacterium]
MYQEFYGFRELPFNVTSDPDFFFPSSIHEEAFSHLMYGIKHRKGVLVISGEIGTGKTTLCRNLLERVDTTVRTALILNPYFSEAQLLRIILEDLGIEGCFRNKLELIHALNDYLLAESAEGNNVVLIIDEAQDLKPRQLEQIRLLSNLETQKHKLLQIILVGQPELLDILRRDDMRQINQRISVRYHIMPLKKEEITDYVYHRLKIAAQSQNGSRPAEFTPEAVDALYHFSRGTPRLINIICDRALLLGFVNGSHTIDQAMICKSAKETS